MTGTYAIARYIPSKMLLHFCLAKPKAVLVGINNKLPSLFLDTRRSQNVLDIFIVSFLWNLLTSRRIMVIQRDAANGARLPTIHLSTVETELLLGHVTEKYYTHDMKINTCP